MNPSDLRRYKTAHSRRQDASMQDSSQQSLPEAYLSPHPMHRSPYYRQFVAQTEENPSESANTSLDPHIYNTITPSSVPRFASRHSHYTAHSLLMPQTRPYRPIQSCTHNIPMHRDNWISLHVSRSVSHHGNTIPPISFLGQYNHTPNEAISAMPTFVSSTLERGGFDHQIQRQMSSDTPQTSRHRLCPEDEHALSGPLASGNFGSPPTSEVAQPQTTKCMVFTFEGKLGVPLSLVFAGSDALYGLADSEDRSFFEGFGEKVMYKIPLELRAAYVKQKRCRRVKQDVHFYITRSEIVRHVAEVVRDFITAIPDFAADPAFSDWPNGLSAPDLGNFVLIEVRKTSKATVQPVFRYCRSSMTQ